MMWIQKRNACILYMVVLACACFGFDTQWGYQADSAWWTHLTYHFAHGNIFHLAANMLVVFLLLFNRRDGWWMWVVSYAVATLCSFMVSTPKPTAGLSGMLFVYYGMVFLKDGVRWKPLLQTAALLLVSCLFASRLAIGLHVFCLLAGTLVGGTVSMLNEIKTKSKMYNDERD